MGTPHHDQAAPTKIKETQRSFHAEVGAARHSLKAARSVGFKPKSAARRIHA